MQILRTILYWFSLTGGKKQTCTHPCKLLIVFADQYNFILTDKSNSLFKTQSSSPFLNIWNYWLASLILLPTKTYFILSPPVFPYFFFHWSFPSWAPLSAVSFLKISIITLFTSCCTFPWLFYSILITVLINFVNSTLSSVSLALVISPKL